MQCLLLNIFTWKCPRITIPPLIYHNIHIQIEWMKNCVIVSFWVVCHTFAFISKFFSNSARRTKMQFWCCFWESNSFFLFLLCVGTVWGAVFDFCNIFLLLQLMLSIWKKLTERENKSNHFFCWVFYGNNLVSMPKFWLQDENF